jgi:hypothetical protein
MQSVRLRRHLALCAAIIALTSSVLIVTQSSAIM